MPDVLPASLLPQANSLDQFVRPLALRLAGPAIGGFLIEGVGVGWAFALNAATFAVSAAALLAMAPPTRRAARRGGVSVVGDIRVGFAYVRKHVWLWGTFASAAVAYLCFMGPAEVLLPFLVKNDLHGSAADLGLVFAAGGIGSRRLRRDHGPARHPAARHHLHVPRVDARDGRDRRLRARHRRLAADDRQHRLQRRWRRPARSCGRPPSSATSRPRCSAASRASTG